MTDITTCSNQHECGSDNRQNIQIQEKLSGFLSGILLKLKTAYAQRRQRKIDRDAFRSLMSLDEKSLKDIGVSRDDIIWASKLAMHENAAKELEKIRANNIATNRLKASKRVVTRKL